MAVAMARRPHRHAAEEEGRLPGVLEQQEPALFRPCEQSDAGVYHNEPQTAY